MGKHDAPTPADEAVEPVEPDAAEETAVSSPVAAAALSATTDKDDDAADSDDNGKKIIPTHVDIGGQQIRLGAPDDYLTCEEIVAFVKTNSRRGMGAALGLCWRGKDPPRLSYSDCDYNIGMYGGRVINELHARGIPDDEIYPAGLAAWQHMIRYRDQHRVTEKEVAATEDFS